MKDLKKMMSSEQDDSMASAKADMKRKALGELSKEMGRMSGSSLLEKMKQPKASVTVATDDPKKLPEALEQAEELTSQLVGEEGEESSEEEMMEEEMTPEQMKEEIKRLKAMMK